MIVLTSDADLASREPEELKNFYDACLLLGVFPLESGFDIFSLWGGFELSPLGASLLMGYPKGRLSKTCRKHCKAIGPPKATMAQNTGKRYGPVKTP